MISCGILPLGSSPRSFDTIETWYGQIKAQTRSCLHPQSSTLQRKYRLTKTTPVTLVDEGCENKGQREVDRVPSSLPPCLSLNCFVLFHHLEFVQLTSALHHKYLEILDCIGRSCSQDSYFLQFMILLSQLYSDCLSFFISSINLSFFLGQSKSEIQGIPIPPTVLEEAIFFANGSILQCKRTFYYYFSSSMMEVDLNLYKLSQALLFGNIKLASKYLRVYSMQLHVVRDHEQLQAMFRTFLSVRVCSISSLLASGTRARCNQRCHPFILTRNVGDTVLGPLESDAIQENISQYSQIVDNAKEREK